MLMNLLWVYDLFAIITLSHHRVFHSVKVILVIFLTVCWPLSISSDIVRFTHPWSQPLHILQISGAQQPLADRGPVRGKHLIDKPHASDEAVLLQLLEILVYEPLGISHCPKTIFLLPFIHDAHTHTRGRHCGRVEALCRKSRTQCCFLLLHTEEYTCYTYS